MAEASTHFALENDALLEGRQAAPQEDKGLEDRKRRCAEGAIVDRGHVGGNGHIVCVRTELYHHLRHGLVGFLADFLSTDRH